MEIVEFSGLSVTILREGRSDPREDRGDVRRSDPVRLQGLPAAHASAGVQGGRGSTVRARPGTILGVPRHAIRQPGRSGGRGSEALRWGAGTRPGNVRRLSGYERDGETRPAGHGRSGGLRRVVHADALHQRPDGHRRPAVRGLRDDHQRRAGAKVARGHLARINRSMDPVASAEGQPCVAARPLDSRSGATLHLILGGDKGCATWSIQRGILGVRPEVPRGDGAVGAPGPGNLQHPLRRRRLAHPVGPLHWP